MATSALIQGGILGFAMIIPIGVQNAFILSQGIRCNHHYLTAFICLICDIVLTTVGVFGGSKLITSSQYLLLLIGWGGILFLLFYASSALYRAYQGHYAKPNQTKELASRKAVIITTLAVTLLNPHVYIDTVVILGNIGSTFNDNDKVYFTMGAIFAASLWFFGLSASAAKLAPWLSRPRILRIIDLFISGVMLFVAYKLYASLLAY